MKCPRCQHENPSKARSCVACGAGLRPRATLRKGGASPKRVGARVHDLEKRLTEAQKREAEAFEQQAATSEILGAISRAKTDVQPVFDTIASSALRLCAGLASFVFRYDGTLLHLVALDSAEGVDSRPLQHIFPAPPEGVTFAGRVIATARLLYIADIEHDPDAPPGLVEFAQANGFRSIFAAPLLLDGRAIGAIGVTHRNVAAFTPRQGALLQTFADQAVIAIENVRLFTELQEKNKALTEAHAQMTEALEQQTATSEILRVISGSPTNLQPVLDAVAERAARLCSADDVKIHLVAGDTLRLAAQVGPIPSVEARPIIPTRHIGRAVLERRTIHVHDMQIALDEFPDAAGDVRTFGARTALATPLLREGMAIGVIQIRRLEVEPFSEKQIALLETFADQAVIAIENVRLFNETKDALERQTATSEILRVISSSPTDVQPVFDAIVQSASRLCNGHWAIVVRFDGELIHLVAQHNMHPDVPNLGEEFPCPPSRRLPASRAIAEGRLVHIPDAGKDPDLAPRVAHRARSFLVVPMLREGAPVGAIAVSRPAPGPFPPNHIELLSTFAGQAVIAIENVRLFTELEEKNRSLSEALDRQTATADVLRIIAQSPTELQPVLDAIATSAVRLCAASDAVIERLEGDRFYNAAHAGAQMKGLVGLPLPLTRRFPGGRAVLDRKRVILDDIQLVAESEYPDTLELLKLNTVHSCAEIPLLSEGKPLGNLAVLRAEVRPFTNVEIALLETFADQAVIAIENVRLFKELEARNTELREALDHQTATANVLAIISRSPTDVQPVFDAIARSAAGLCEAELSAVYRYDGELIHVVANALRSAEQRHAFEQLYPMPPGRGTPVARAILEGRTQHVPDTRDDPKYLPALARTGFRSALAVPMVREGAPIGAVAVGRMQVREFTDAEVKLLETFADQAVIAIENVRLFKELEARNRELTEALDQQTATSEVLKVISASTFDLQPILDILVENATRLCGATRGFLWRFDGELFRIAASYGHSAEVRDFWQRNPIRPGRGSVTGRAALERRTIHIPDILADPEYQLAEGQTGTDYRTLLGVPMIREGVLVGVFGLQRAEVKPFTDKQIELVATFADQAVIAIENVRLFTELQEKNQALTQAHAQVSEALDQQTATAEVLRVIAGSPTNVQPVFATIMKNALRLCSAETAAVLTFDGHMIHAGAFLNIPANAEEQMRRLFPRVPDRTSAAGRAILTGDVAEIPDVEADPDFAFVSAVRAGDLRSNTAVPMVRDGRVIGTINLARAVVGRFSEIEIAGLKTFADQAVIAIENVRLFTELQTSNSELRVALEQQTATSELLKVIGRSTFDLQPVFDTLAENAIQLCEAEHALIYRFDGRVLRIMSTRNATAALKEHLGNHPLGLDRGSIAGRAVLDRRTTHVHDVLADPEYTLGSLSGLGRFDADRARTIIAIPMLRGGETLGVIAIYRYEVRPFTESQIALLETFADQAAIAIENARLLTELQARTDQLGRSVQELQALGEVSHALSSTLDLDTVLDTIVTRASQLAGTDACSVFEYDAATEAFHLRATNNLDDEVVTLARKTPTRKGEGVQGRMALTRQPVQVPDIAAEDAYHGPLRDILLRTGTRAVLAIPMLREDELIGGLTVNKRTPGEFSSEVIELLTTFATQSALAIQNARLFREIADKSRQLEVASQHKSEFLANMSHELRTPLNAVIGFSEVLSERMFGDLNEKQDEYLKDIHASGQHLLSLINDILDLSKIEAGRMELELTDFDLPATIDNALTLVRERASRRGVTLHQTVDHRLGQIRGDERKIKQVLLNLLSNALKFTPEGGRIDVRAGLGDRVAEISVADTGVGIAPEDQEAIFEEFKQVGTASKKVEGTGLGLALSRKFIELHGGKIWVESQVGKGSTFTFTIPMRQGG